MYQEIEKTCRELCRQKCDFIRANYPFYASHGLSHAEDVARLADDLLFWDRDWKHLAVLKCAAYLHDIGMALGCGEVNNLGLEIEARYVKKVLEKPSCGGNGEEQAKNMLKFFRECQGGSSACLVERHALTVEIPEECGGLLGSKNLCGQSELAEFIRKFHPWLSAQYVRRYLPQALYGLLKRGEAELFAEAVATTVNGHSRHFEPVLKGVLWGADLSEMVRKLSAALMIADALDYTSTRILDDVLIEVANHCPRQLKHWVFKNDVREVVVRRGGVVIRMEPDELGFLGLLTFELGENFVQDFERASELYRGYADLRICVEFRGVTYDVTPVLKELRATKYFDESLKNRIDEITGDLGIDNIYKGRVESNQAIDKTTCEEKEMIFDLLAVAKVKGRRREEVKRLFEIDLGLSDVIGRLRQCET